MGCQNISILLYTLKAENVDFSFLHVSTMYSSTQDA
jgi:hypothetical protein